MEITTILGSAVLAAIISAIVSRINSERIILIDNITKERKNWRETIRNKSNCVFMAYYSNDELSLKKLKSEFQLILSPFDHDDIDILDSIEDLITKCVDCDDSTFNDFNTRICLLLKHDWERAKIEANPYENMGRTADRMTFKEYKKKKNRSYEAESRKN